MDYKKILEQGKKEGFSDLEFQISSSTSLSIDVFKGKVDKNQVHSDFSIVLSGLYKINLPLFQQQTKILILRNY